MAAPTATDCTLLTNHARVLLCIAQDPDVRLREIGERVGITERAAQRIVGELSDAGYLTREREGRRNRYTLNADLPVPDPLAHRRSVGELVAVLTGERSASSRARAREGPAVNGGAG